MADIRRMTALLPPKLRRWRQFDKTETAPRDGRRKGLTDLAREPQLV